MKILMLGWEFPPFFAGGVGMVCYEIAKEISKNHQELFVEYVIPYGPEKELFSKNFQIESANFSKERLKNIKINSIESNLFCYDSFENFEIRKKEYIKKYLEKFKSRNKSIKELYGENLLEEVQLYALRILEKYKNSNFDVIHAHDWTTIPAALLLKKITGIPVILHVHITEYDKNGGKSGDTRIMSIEKEGFENADILIAVSEFTKNRLINNYNINPDKIRVIHNGGISDLNKIQIDKNNYFNEKKEKIVLFTGRITLQKGVEYFIRTAKKVLDFCPDVKFIVAGTGDMLPNMINLSRELGIENKINFHGFYTRNEADELFSKANVFVMPSVSEPFGIVPLEAIAKGTPCIISKQSGVSEVINNCFKIDFWDIDEMTNKIIALLRYKTLNQELSKKVSEEYNNLNWKKPVNKMIELYELISSKRIINEGINK